MTFREFTQTSVVPAPLAAVWERVTDFAGINDELMPYLRMRPPRRYADRTIDDVPVGEPLGKAWLFYGGVLPLDYDDLMLTELEPNSHFQEVSTMLAMRRWEHRRELRAVDAHRTEVTDTIGFEPRTRIGGALVEPLLRRVFAHRHRKLAAYFAGRQH